MRIVRAVPWVVLAVFCAAAPVGSLAGPLETDQLRQLLECASYYRKLLERLTLRRLDASVVDAALIAGQPRDQANMT